MISNSGLKKVGLLFSAIVDKKSDAPYIEILTNIDHLTGKLYLGADGVSAEAAGGYTAKKSADPCPTRIILAKAKEWLDAGDDFDQ